MLQFRGDGAMGKGGVWHYCKPWRNKLHFSRQKSKFYMSSNEIPSKVVYATADRANVYFRQYSEVFWQLKEDRPWMLKIHCINHRVEQSVKSAFSHLLIDNVDKFYQIPQTIKSTLMTLEMKLDGIRNEDEFLDSYVCWFKVAAVDSDDCVSGEFVPVGKKKKQLKFIQGNSDTNTHKKIRCSFHKGKISTQIF